MELNKIYNEDCLGLEGLCKLPDKSVDMILCDLPYGVLNQKWDNILDFNRLWAEYERIIKDKGAILLFGSEPFSSKIRMSNIKLYKYDWYWKKERPSNFQIMNYQPGRVVETISVFSKSGASYSKGREMNYYPIKELRDKPRKSNSKVYGNYDKNILNNNNNFQKDNYKEYKDKHPINVLEFSNDKGKIHPTQKPLELCKYLIKTYSKEGDVILDNCMGSGTTAIACLETGRNYIGFELDKEYYNKSLKRISDYLNLGE